MKVLLIGGSPCQDFSQANIERKGLEGEKSGLFTEYKRLFDEIGPDYFLLENVSMEKEVYAVISQELNVQPIEVNSELISCQSRKRVYWTNFRTSSDLLGMNYVDIPQPKNKNIKFIDCLHDKGYSPKLKARALLESDSRFLSTPIKMFHRWYSAGFTNLIFLHEGHYILCKQDYDRNYKGMSAEEIDNTNYDRSVYEGLRYMTVEESERCQTVPDGYTSMLTENEAKSLLGDGWTVDVVAYLMSYIPIKHFDIVVSLFDGMSCGQIALNKLGITYDYYFASDIKPFAIKCTQENYPNTIQIGDVTKVKWKDILSLVV